MSLAIIFIFVSQVAIAAADIDTSAWLDTPAVPSTVAGEIQDDVTLSEDILNQLNEEITLATKLLSLEDQCDSRVPLLLRLADLLQEKARRVLLAPESVADSNVQSTQAQLQAGQYYQNAYTSCPQAAQMPQLLYHYGKLLLDLNRNDEAYTIFTALIQNYPNSPYHRFGYYFAGEYLLNFKNDAAAALQRFSQVNADPNTPLYFFALHRQGLCQIQLHQFDDAKKKFAIIANLTGKKDYGKSKLMYNLRQQALKNYARSYVLNDPNTNNTTLTAQFALLASASEQVTMLDFAAKSLVLKNKHLQAIEVLQQLAAQTADEDVLATTYFLGRMMDGLESSHQEQLMIDIASRFTSYLRNKLCGPTIFVSALQDLQGTKISKHQILRLGEFNLRQWLVHDIAPKKSSYPRAEKLFPIYLSTFSAMPCQEEVEDLSNLIAQMQIKWGDVLLNINHVDHALKQYDAVLAHFSPQTPSDPLVSEKQAIVQMARSGRVHAFDTLVLNKRGVKSLLKPIATLAKAPAEVIRLMTAANAYLAASSQSNDLDRQENDGAVRLILAREQFLYGQIDQARENAMRVFTANLTSLREQSFLLLTRCYQAQQQWGSIEALVRKTLANPNTLDSQFKHILLSLGAESAFTNLQHLAASPQRIPVDVLAARFLDFYSQYPHSSVSAAALENAGYYFDQAEQKDEAYKARLLLLERFPHSRQSKEALLRLANAAENATDFTDAAKWYQRFYEEAVDDSRRQDAFLQAIALLALEQQDTARNTLINNYLQNKKSTSASGNLSAKLKLERCGVLPEDGHLVWQLNVSQRQCLLAWQKNDFFNAAAAEQCRALAVLARPMPAMTFVQKVQTLNKLVKQLDTIRKSKTNKSCNQVLAEIYFELGNLQIGEADKIVLKPADPQHKTQFRRSLEMLTNHKDQALRYLTKASQSNAEITPTALAMMGQVVHLYAQRLLNVPLPLKINGRSLTAEEANSIHASLKKQAEPHFTQAAMLFKACREAASKLQIPTRKPAECWAPLLLAANGAIDDSVVPELLPPPALPIDFIADHLPYSFLSQNGNDFVPSCQALGQH